MQDHVSIPTPDNKKKDLRYRLGSLLCLHEQFMAEYNMDCHYSTFCSYVPETVLKHKPEDWGTCLCMTCLNPELKLGLSPSGDEEAGGGRICGTTGVGIGV